MVYLHAAQSWPLLQFQKKHGFFSGFTIHWSCICVFNLIQGQLIGISLWKTLYRLMYSKLHTKSLHQIERHMQYRLAISILSRG